MSTVHSAPATRVGGAPLTTHSTQQMPSSYRKPPRYTQASASQFPQALQSITKAQKSLCSQKPSCIFPGSGIRGLPQSRSRRQNCPRRISSEQAGQCLYHHLPHQARHCRGAKAGIWQQADTKHWSLVSTPTAKPEPRFSFSLVRCL